MTFSDPPRPEELYTDNVPLKVLWVNTCKKNTSREYILEGRYSGEKGMELMSNVRLRRLDANKNYGCRTQTYVGGSHIISINQIHSQGIV